MLDDKIKYSTGDFDDASYLAWWLETYPTVESAEEELLKMKEDGSYEVYHDRYCLERVIEIHKNNKE